MCCNQVLYLALNRPGQDLRAGFIHVPLLPEQAAASRPQMVPTMALDLMLRGVEGGRGNGQG